MTALGATPKPRLCRASAFIGKLLPGRGRRASVGAIERETSIDPRIIEATMMATGSWFSWEVVHFMSEAADGRNDK